MVFVLNNMRFGIELSDDVVGLLVLLVILGPVIFFLYHAAKN